MGLNFVIKHVIHVTFQFTGLSEPWQAYTLSVDQVCKNDTINEDGLSAQTAKSSQKPHLGLMRLITPWIQDSTNSFIGRNKSNRYASWRHFTFVMTCF